MSYAGCYHKLRWLLSSYSYEATLAVVISFHMYNTECYLILHEPYKLLSFPYSSGAMLVLSSNSSWATWTFVNSILIANMACYYLISCVSMDVLLSLLISYMLWAVILSFILYKGCYYLFANVLLDLLSSHFSWDTCDIVLSFLMSYKGGYHLISHEQYGVISQSSCATGAVTLSFLRRYSGCYPSFIVSYPAWTVVN